MAIQTFVADSPATGAGKKVTKQTGLAAPDTFTFVNDGKTYLYVIAAATETKVKVKIQTKVDGIAVAEREVAIKEGIMCLGPFDKTTYNNPETEKVEFTLSAVTAVELFIIKKA